MELHLFEGLGEAFITNDATSPVARDAIGKIIEFVHREMRQGCRWQAIFDFFGANGKNVLEICGCRNPGEAGVWHEFMTKRHVRSGGRDFLSAYPK